MGKNEQVISSVKALFEKSELATSVYLESKECVYANPAFERILQAEGEIIKELLVINAALKKYISKDGNTVQAYFTSIGSGLILVNAVVEDSQEQIVPYIAKCIRESICSGIESIDKIAQLVLPADMDKVQSITNGLNGANRAFESLAGCFLIPECIEKLQNTSAFDFKINDLDACARNYTDILSCILCYYSENVKYAFAFPTGYIVSACCDFYSLAVLFTEFIGDGLKGEFLIDKIVIGASYDDSDRKAAVSVEYRITNKKNTHLSDDLPKGSSCILRQKLAGVLSGKFGCSISESFEEEKANLSVVFTDVSLSNLSMISMQSVNESFSDDEIEKAMEIILRGYGIKARYGDTEKI